MEQKEKSQKVLAAEKKLLQAKENLSRAKREDAKKLRSQQNTKKYAMGGMMAKYFPECYDFSNEELLRIVACAFSLPDVKNMIRTVVRDRTESGANNYNTEDAKYDVE